MKSLIIILAFLVEVVQQVMPIWYQSIALKIYTPYHVCASTRLVLLPIHNRLKHMHIVVTLQKDRHILVIDLILLDLG